MSVLGGLLAPKTLKKARGTVRKAGHPVHAATRIMTPKPVKKRQRAAHPLQYAELKAEDAVVITLRGKPRRQQPRRMPSRTQGRSAPMATGRPPSAWRPRPGWGTIRDYELLCGDQGGARVSCTFIPDDGSEPVIVDSSADKPLPEVGEYARAIMPEGSLTIKVAPDSIRRAEGESFPA